MSKTKAPRVFVSGVFDMQNFGDLLFPLVAQHELDQEVIAVAPTAMDPVFNDARTTISLDEFAATVTARDALVIGGGHIIHAHPVDLLPIYRAHNVQDWAGFGLWYTATVVAALNGAKVLWNAPGVPHPLPGGLYGLVDAALQATSYASVRDAGSLAMLAKLTDAPVHMVPDTIAGLPHLWPADHMHSVFEAQLKEHGYAPDTKVWTLHARDRSLTGEDVGALSRRISNLARDHELLPVICAVGEAHQDSFSANRLAAGLDVAHLVIAAPPSLKSFAAWLAGSTLFSGSSLHGYIVAAAYGVPSLLVGRPAYRKFEGFLAHSAAHSDLAKSWGEALEKVPMRLQSETRQGFPDAMMTDLENHWAMIRNCISGPNTKVAQQAGLVQRHMRHVLDKGGMAALTRPVLPGSARRGYVDFVSTLDTGERSDND